jgi:hypothetical protein
LEHTRQTIEALARNELVAESPLIVFSDGPKNGEDAVKVEAVRALISNITGFQSVKIVCQPVNQGLAASLIRGVTEVCQAHQRVIVVEDDIVTSPFFLRYMNDALQLYEQTPEVVCIHGYVFPVAAELPESFFIRGAHCWGWATWRRAWELFEPNGARLLSELEARGLTRELSYNGAFDYGNMLRAQVNGKIDSWAIRWLATAFLRGKLTLFPGRSLVKNVGMDGSGRHCDATSVYRVALTEEPVRLVQLPPEENQHARRAFEAFFRSIKPEPAPSRVKGLLKKVTPPAVMNLWRRCRGSVGG